MKRLPLLRVGLMLICWGIFVQSGGLGLNVETLLVALGSILYLRTGWLKATPLFA